MERHTRERARWFSAAQKGDINVLPQLNKLATNGQESAYWRAVAAGLLWQWADKSKATLITALKDSSPLVREKAVKSLESLVDAGDAGTIRALQSALEDPSRNVRAEAAWILKRNVDMRSRAGQELQAMLDFNADQPAGQYHLAIFDSARHQPTDALKHIQKGLSWDPQSPPLLEKAAEVSNMLSSGQIAAPSHR